MKNRGTYLLLGLFFAGLAGLWAADFAQVPTRARRERMNNRILQGLVNARPDDLRKVEILGGDRPMVFERRDGNRWQMTAPMDVAADPSMVETLAYNLKELTRRPDSATLEGNPERYGLAPPDRTVRFWGSATDAPLATLELGRTSLDRRFVRAVGSEGIEAVDARGLDLIKLTPGRWRDREMIRVPSFEVDAVSLSGAGRALKFRRGRDAWRLVEPFRTLASEARVDGLIADLASLRVLDDTRFVADDVPAAGLDRYGLKTPSLTIEVDAGRADHRRPPQVIQVGKPVEGKPDLVYARRGDQDDVVALDQRFLKDLKAEPDFFRNPKVADIHPVRVMRVEVEDAEGGSTELSRMAGDWSIVRPEPASADRQAVQDFLKSLDQLQTSTYLTPDQVSDPGLDRPALTLKIWEVRDPRDSAGPPPATPQVELALTLRVGRRDVPRKTIYAQLDGDPAILALPDSASDFLPRGALAFRDRKILAADPGAIEQIKVAGSGRNVTLNAPILKLDTLGIAPYGWWMAEPVEAPADSPSVGKFLRVLSNLRAETLVTDRPGNLEKYGLKSPTLTLTWSTLPFPSKPSGPLDRRSLMIGSAVSDRPTHRYAKLDDRPLVFTVGPEVLGVLDPEWRDHRVVTFDPDRLSKVQLNWPDRGFALGPTGDSSGRRWSVQGAVDAPSFDPDKIEPLVRAASRLTTTRYLQHLGDFPPVASLTPPRLAIRFDFDDGSPSRTLGLGASTGVGQLVATTDPGPGGAIFLVPEAPFAPWLQPPRRHDDLPDDVFAP